MTDKLLNLMEKGNELLGCDYAIIGGAMTWVSDSNLVSAISNAGAFGVLACGAMSAESLSKEIEVTTKKTDKNFGVNLILAHPDLQDLIDVCGEHKVSHIFFAGGIVEKKFIEKSHSYGMKCFGFAPTLILAKRMFKNGVDGLIIEGNEAGGHIGPVSTLVLVQEILLELQGYPIFVAGGIVRGEIYASMLNLGAYGCQLGSVFACCKDAAVHADFKKAFVLAKSRDAVSSVQLDKNFPVTAVRALENDASKEFLVRQKEALFKFESGEWSLEEARLTLEKFWAGALRRAAVEGDIKTGSMMAGQSVGLINAELSVEEIIAKLVNEADEFLNKV